MHETFKQYQVEPQGFWRQTWVLGDGYDVMGVAGKHGWEAVGAWGRDHAYPLGSWPYAMIYHR